MSSLGVSLLLLVVVAIAVVVGYNLRQGAWPRWQQACRSTMAGLRARAKAGRVDAPGRRDVPSANGRRSVERGEPRLGGNVSEARGFAPAPADEDDLAQAGGAHLAHLEDAPKELHDGEPVGQRSLAGDSVVPAAGEPSRDAAPFGQAAAAARDRATLGAPDGDAGQGASAPAATVAPSDAMPPSPTVPASQPLRASAAPSARAAAPAAAGPVPRVPSSPQSSAVESDEHDAASPQAASTTSAAVAPGPALSDVCDCVVEIVPAAALAGERLLAIAQRFRRSGSKPVAFDAHTRADGDGFEAPVAGRTYARIRVGILMANRHGPLNAMEFSEFVSAVQAIAESLSARAEMPAMGPVLARARDLDSTCAQLDVQIGVNVEAPEAVEPAQLAALAPALSLVERGSHRYVRPGPQGEPLFSLGFSDSPSRLTFLLDVPRVPAALEPFARMVQAAGACAQRLDARLVDDSGKSLTQASLAQIARQLEQRYESLEAIGLPAGSTLACKVFN